MLPRVCLVLLLGTLSAGSSSYEDLVLNGAGTRKALFIELYTCELYVSQRTHTYQELLREDLPVTVLLKVHGNPPDTMPDHWIRTLREELSDKVFRKVRDEYDDLVAGDEVRVEYRPGEGTRVTVNGGYLFTDPGNGLMAALLDQWVGAEPVSESLKLSLLGGDR